MGISKKTMQNVINSVINWDHNYSCESKWFCDIDRNDKFLNERRATLVMNVESSTQYG